MTHTQSQKYGIETPKEPVPIAVKSYRGGAVVRLNPMDLVAKERQDVRKKGGDQ
jgi:hypothetical protein